ncbi:MAG: glycosyltransferase family 39 protein, partial [Deltaproteobacteria bacterium]|nr:glycosyltransferase family 39 protein [Deltaproteobacteria bacterium]
MAFTLPFLNHAYHIDETLFLRISEQIKKHPLNPYGFPYNWNIDYEPMHKIAAFPPLFSYYLAAFDWNRVFTPEWLTHLSIIPFAWMSALSSYFLAMQFGFSKKLSLFAACALVVSPVFVLSSNLAMPDIAATGLATWAIALSIRGWKNSSTLCLVLGGLLLGGATWMRYNAVPLIPIVFLLGLSFSKYKKASIPAIAATLVFFCWIGVSSIFSGHAHTAETLSIFAKTTGWMSRFWAMNTQLTMSTFIPFFFLP